jgi:hypothetical protein
MVFVSVSVLMSVMLVHIALSSYCVVQRLAALLLCSSLQILCCAAGWLFMCWVATCCADVLHGIRLCCAAACRSCAVQQLAYRVLGSGLPLVCCASDCRGYAEYRLSTRVLCRGLPRVLCSCLLLLSWVAVGRARTMVYVVIARLDRRFRFVALLASMPLVFHCSNCPLQSECSVGSWKRAQMRSYESEDHRLGELSLLPIAYECLDGCSAHSGYPLRKVRQCYIFYDIHNWTVLHLYFGFMIHALCLSQRAFAHEWSVVSHRHVCSPWVCMWLCQCLW